MRWAMTHDGFAFFRHCHNPRQAYFRLITSETCANCGITYAAHFEHPERCWLLRGIAEPWSTMTGSTR